MCTAASTRSDMTRSAREARFLAVVYAGGQGAALSHDALAELYRVRRRRAVRHRCRCPAQAGISARCPLPPRHATSTRGTSPPTRASPSRRSRACSWTSPTTTTDDELANVIHEADFRGWFDEAKVREAADRATGRHHLDVLERALELRKQGSAGTKSKAERAQLARLREQGENPLPNVRTRGLPGRPVLAGREPGRGDRPGPSRPPAKPSRRRTARRDTRSRRIRGAACGYPIARLSSGTSVTNMCPGAWVIISSGRLAAATACGRDAAGPEHRNLAVPDLDRIAVLGRAQRRDAEHRRDRRRAPARRARPGSGR